MPNLYQTPDVQKAQMLEERWQQILAQFELWTQIWAANPELVKRSGSRVEELMMPIEAVRQRYAEQWR
jgi:hypothetical protein